MPEFDFETGYRRLEAAMNGGADQVPLIKSAALAALGLRFVVSAMIFSAKINYFTP